MNISHRDYLNILEILTPVMDDLELRETIVSRSFFRTALFEQLQTHGATSEFTTKLLNKLIQYGELESGQHALAILLETSSQLVGSPSKERLLAARDVIKKKQNETNNFKGAVTAPLSITSRKLTSRFTSLNENSSKQKPITDRGYPIGIMCHHCTEVNKPIPHDNSCINCHAMLIPAKQDITSTQRILEKSKPGGANALSLVFTLYLQTQRVPHFFELDMRRDKYIVIGRNIDSSIPHHIDLSTYRGGQLGVSRNHLLINYSEEFGVVFATDLDSTNGTFVNKQPLMPHISRVLMEEDLLKIGYFHLFFSGMPN